MIKLIAIQNFFYQTHGLINIWIQNDFKHSYMFVNKDSTKQKFMNKPKYNNQT